MSAGRSTGLLIISVIITLTGCAVDNDSGLEVRDLRCEFREDPVGLDITQPRLSWILSSEVRGKKQSACQVLVASSLEVLNKNRGDIWNSRKLRGHSSNQLEFNGISLQSKKAYYWKARVWDQHGRPAKWSEAAMFEMGLLEAGEWHGAIWITDGKEVPVRAEDFYLEDPAPLFRKEFKTGKEIAKARLYISGLGYYEASLNGKKIGDEVLDPPWTNYTEKIYYATHDVTGLLKQGENCLGITLGNGWYNPLPILMWGRRNLRESLPTGRPTLICQLHLEYLDGSTEYVVSDGNWKVGEGPLLRNNVFLGEVYDARREQPGWDLPGFPDTSWRAPGFAPGRHGRLAARDMPPIRITKVIDPVRITEPEAGTWIFDFGQNFAGGIRMHLDVPSDTRITLRYGELLNPDGSLNPMTSVCGQVKGMRENESGERVLTGGPGSPEIAWQEDVYIARGGGQESWTPKFTFHGFRYVEVSGLPGRPDPGMIEGLRMSTDIRTAGRFQCSDTLFNRIQSMCDWTFRSNLFSVQSDCPHREKFGYGGDIAATSEAFIMNYDMHGFYAKTVRDWKEASLEDGMFTDTAPFVGIQYCGPAWAMAHPLLLLQLYTYYGDKRLIEEQYPAAKKWFDLVIRDNPFFIVSEGLSDHEGLTERPEEVMITPLFYQSACIMEKLAGILELEEDAGKYRDLASDISAAFTGQFLDEETGKVGPGTQGSQVFALNTGILPEEFHGKVLEYLVSDILNENKGHLNTGIFGTKFLLETLPQKGYADAAFGMVSQKDFPGWGHMVLNGATTLWETWAFSDNIYSHNHPMFGSVSQWFYHWIGGIRPAPDAVGFNRIILNPGINSPLSWAKSSYHSIRGEIICNWEKTGEEIRLNIQIPVGATAILHLPLLEKQDVLESGNPVEGEEGKPVFNLVSGSYLFTIRN